MSGRRDEGAQLKKDTIAFRFFVPWFPGTNDNRTLKFQTHKHNLGKSSQLVNLGRSVHGFNIGAHI